MPQVVDPDLARAPGATGLTFFDDEVTDFILPAPLARGSCSLTALGHPDRAALRLRR